jgi:Predicted glycosylase
MRVERSVLNPIIRPENVKPYMIGFEVVCVFNAGVARIGDEVILLLRVAEKPVSLNKETILSPVLDESTGKIKILKFDASDPENDFSDSRVIKTGNGLYLTSISYLRVARSKDGVHFDIDGKPALFPENIYEMYGIEDPRITKLGDAYYINYSAVSQIGITTCLASTVDFKAFKKHGAIFGPDNKDVAIFPEKINGSYYALNRPASAYFKTNDIWIADSNDLVHWGNHKYLMGVREGFWDDGRVGASAVPFRIEEGWLEIYHGASRNNRYCLGAALLDAEEPWKVIHRTETPVMAPEEEYETRGFFGNVIFNCGALYEEGTVKIYYGASDTYVCYAEIQLDDIRRKLVCP